MMAVWIDTIQMEATWNGNAFPQMEICILNKFIVKPNIRRENEKLISPALE